MEAQFYQIVSGGTTKRARPRFVETKIKGRRTAFAHAKQYHDDHPKTVTQVIKVERVRVYRPKKNKKK